MVDARRFPILGTEMRLWKMLARGAAASDSRDKRKQLLEAIKESAANYEKSAAMLDEAIRIKERHLR